MTGVEQKKKTVTRELIKKCVTNSTVKEPSTVCTDLDGWGILITDAALKELQKSGYTQRVLDTIHENSALSDLVFYNPTTKKSIFVAVLSEMELEKSGNGIQYGENGPRIDFPISVDRPDLVAQIGKRDKEKNTYVALGIHDKNRLIAPETTNIVIGNEAYLITHNGRNSDARNRAIYPGIYSAISDPEPNHRVLSIYREGKHIKFAYNSNNYDPNHDYITSIPADKVKTLRIGDVGEFIKPQSITAEPMNIDLANSIATGKIVPVAEGKGTARKKEKRAELALPEGIVLAEANPQDTVIPSLPSNRTGRQI